ncbi:hypothetical protein MUA04_13890 [Enterobacteriaceae bacterium H11S18]|nr:hypothetical protein [Dryocola clanedunensis]MCT4711271.1 hypothetical protein [Dryocola clanedunensis]
MSFSPGFMRQVVKRSSLISVDDAGAYPPYVTDGFVGRISAAPSGELLP